MSLTDFAPDAHRLAMELECLLLDCTDTRAVSKWWDSANEALDQHRAFCATIEAEATKPQEPCEVPPLPDLPAGIVKHENLGELYDRLQVQQYAVRYYYATPQPCPKCIEITKEAVKLGNYILDLNAKCDEKQSYIDVFEGRYADLSAKCAELEAEVLSKEGMALVTKEDAENYCRIFSLLGMEEEGSPIEGVEHLISLRDGMTCGDCNDTGWLENREEGRYPCTCMTEAEPYQILVAERDDWKSRYESNLSVNQMHSDNNAEMLKFNAKLLAERDALKKQNNAYSSLFKSQEKRLLDRHAQSQQYKDAVATLDSEKEANAILTQERDAMAMIAQQMREALRVLLKFAETVGPSSCFWEDVWPEHKNAECCDHSEVIKRNDVDKKDADRYRWLRDTQAELPEMVILRVEEGGSDLDAAIDAEIGAQL